MTTATATATATTTTSTAAAATTTATTTTTTTTTNDTRKMNGHVEIGEIRPDLLQENQQLRQERLCKICLDKEVGVVFIPCGHFATCVSCAPSFNKCPVCRAKIEGAVRTFLS